MKSILAVLAIAGAAAISAPAANAFPDVTGGVTLGQDANIIAVRDGCGINRHFSPRFDRCVWNDDGDRFFFRPHFFFHPHFFHVHRHFM